MAINTERIRNYLKAFDFKKLFIEELGWDRHKSTLDVAIKDKPFHLEAVAHKRGFVAYVCTLTDGSLRIDETISRIESQVAKSVHEHLIIYTDTARKEQIWQWAKREAGKPIVRRHNHFNITQSGDPLIQKLQSLVFTLEDEEDKEGLTIVDVTSKAREAFDVERVTRKFYERFQKEHSGFLKFVDGIPDDDLHRWYASVMLNRLMFIYFIQKKGFLDGDINYLANKLAQSRQKAKDRYYKDFLCPLFFEGFAKPIEQRTDAMKKLLGNICYLNGGIFQKHQIEELHGKTIEVPDSAFAKIFNFFEDYDWHLDDRPLRKGNEINPDVLGYIFEKYINQKQMGAYYTKEDITGYISQNTVIPRIFDMAKEKCKIAFEGEQSIWRLLQDNPDRYIYDAVKKGVKLFLPDNIVLGLDTTKPGLLERRKDWNKPAPPEYALPTEIWREVIARRKRYEGVKTKLANGEVKSINDLITYNLDIRQFAQDVLENSEGPELLRAIWHSIVGRIPRKSNEKFEAGISILDPTCGSGAFLFAALNILEPLYEACLERMQLFVDDSERSGQKNRPEKFSDFKEILSEVDKHPNAKYFIYKSIIINNLFGVDIMDEAIEICKLRLFLKLVAQVDTAEKIEPLPDIDFNIRAGNTLVGYANLEEVKRSMQGDFLKLKSLPAIEENAQLADLAFQQFRYMQTRQNMNQKEFAQAKVMLSAKLKALEDELNGYLAGEYGIKEGTKGAKEQYVNWHKSHKPFHWFIDYYGIIKNGGFDVIIGNPPYVEYSVHKFQYKINENNFRTYPSKNLYSFCYERSKQLLSNGSRIGMIVQISSISTPNMETMVAEIKRNSSVTWLSNYATRPSCLFEGITMNLTIILSKTDKFLKESSPAIYTTNYLRWSPEYRSFLFQCISLNRVDNANFIFKFALPKMTYATENMLLTKVLKNQEVIGNGLEPTKKKTNQELFYRTAGGRYFKIFLDRNFGSESKSNKSKYFCDKYSIHVIIAVLCSDIWWWYYTLHFDMYNCKDYMIFNFPYNYNNCKQLAFLQKLGEKLSQDLIDNAEKKMQSYATTGERMQLIFKPSLSKPIINEIDKVLAKHYGLTEEELDFIINYDIKYRMGKETEETED